MRRFSKVAALVLVASIAITGCGKKKSSDTGESSDELCASGGSGPKIGIAYDVGGRGDKSFNDLAAAGVKKAAGEVKGTCKELAATPGEADTAKNDRLTTLADAGYNPVIAVGGVYSNAVAEVAKKYPKTKFAVVDGFATPAKNLTNLVFSPEQGSYLVGIAAGLKTKANKIGFIGGVHGPIIDPFAAGFKAGIKSVNPKATLEIKWLSDAPDNKAFQNVPGGRTAANALFDDGCDVVFHAAGKSGEGLFAAVAKLGSDKWAIGVDSDQYLTAPAAAKKHILTSSLKRVDVAVYDYIKDFDKGSPPSGFDLYDLKRDGVGIATSGGNVDDIKSQIDAAKQKIVSGEIKVPNKL